MSRRVYTETEFVKIKKALEDREPQAKVPEQDFSEKVVKHIPTEIIAAWTALDGVLAAATGDIYLYWLLFISLAILTPLYMWRVTNEDGLSAAKSQIAIAFAAFIVWVFGMGGPFKTIDFDPATYVFTLKSVGVASWYKPEYGTAALVIASIVLVILLKGKPAPSTPTTPTNPPNT